MIGLKYEVDGVVEVNRALSRFGEGLSDMRPVYEDIIKSFHKLEQKLFDSEGGSGAGGSWAPLADTYGEWKAVNFPGQPILQAQGLLMESLTGHMPWSIIKAERQSLELGTRAPYAIFHQRGTTGMPQRKVISLTEENKREWMKLIHNFAYDKAKEARLL